MYPIKLIKVRSPWTIISISLTFYLLSVVYENIVAPKFNFGGMTYNPRGDWYIELFFLILTSFLLPNKIRRPSDLYNWLYFCLLLVPAAVLSSAQGNNRGHFFLMILALVLVVVFLRFQALIICRNTLQNTNNSKHLPFFSIILFVILVLIMLAISVKGQLIMNFQDVYNFRFDISARMPIFLRYLMPLASISLMGYLVVLSVHRQKNLIFFLLVVIGVFFFSLSSHKAMVFYPIVAACGYFLYKFSRPYLLMLWGYSILAIITLITPEGINFFGSLFAQRIVFIPSHINFYYFDFFSDQPFMLWAESKVSLGLIASQLPMSSVKYIGGLMTGNYEVSANTGWVANGYMNAGITGIAIYAAIISLIFTLIDAWANIYGKQLVGAAFLLPILTLSMSADLFTTLLTTGLFVLLLIFLMTTMVIYIFKPSVFRKNVTANA